MFTVATDSNDVPGMITTHISPSFVFLENAFKEMCFMGHQERLEPLKTCVCTLQYICISLCVCCNSL